MNKTYDGLNRDAAIAAIGTGACAPTGAGYDCNGNLTSNGTSTYTYDAENRLISASGPTRATLAYDPLGRLYQTTTGPRNLVTQFLYDGQNLAAEYDAFGDLLRRYVHGPGTDDPEVWLEGSDWSSPHYLHKDAQGSVAAYSDGAGSVTSSQVYSYGAYGEPQSWGGSRFRYTGQIEIPEAQLYYYKARMYDPATGRFLQTDPIGMKDDLDLYAYVGEDPVDGVDTSGLYVCKTSGAACDRLTNDLATLAKAKDAKGTTKEQRSAITKVLKAYGKLNERNGVVAEFGKLPTGTLGRTMDGGRGQISVTIDYDQIDADTTKRSRNNETASVVGHEGQHVSDEKNGTFRGDIENCHGVACVTPDHYIHLETAAYITQFLINQALHNRSHIGPTTFQDALTRGRDEGTGECATSPTCQ